MTPILLDERAKKVLSLSQQKLTPLLENLSETHFLAGGTAIALFLGHRESIDFDFFSHGSQGSFADLIKKIGQYGFDVSERDKENWAGAEFEEQDEIHVSIGGVRVSLMDISRTLYKYQGIRIGGEEYIIGGLRVASLEELTSMKLYAMITRKKWKDAVDLYFLLRHQEISLDRALEIAETKYYIKIFNQLAILEQLISMDWDMTEAVTYLIDSPPSDSEISEYLRNEGLRIMSQKSKTL